jgi:replication factor A1
MDIDDRAEELAADLGVDKAAVKEDLENLLSYSVPLDEATQNLRRKYGDGTADSGPTSKAIDEITTEDSSVTVTATVLTVGKRSIRYQGDEMVIFEGELADESAKISYTAWEDFDLEPGQTLTIGNAGVREWEGKPELNLGERTSVEDAETSIDSPYAVGGETTLDALSPGDRGVTVEVAVQEVEQKIIDGRDGETEIKSGVVADETARLPFTDWDPHDALGEGASVRIENAYIREFRGVPSVNVTEFSTVTPLSDPVAARETAPERSIRDAVQSGGVFDVTLVGNILQVRDGSGLIERCPECNRVVQNDQCRTHGEVEGEDDLRVRAILDDGTGTATVVLDAELTAEVYGGGIEDAKDHARDAMDKEVVTDQIREELVGREFRARGSLSVDDYGANLDAETFAESDDDPAERARAFLAAVDQ